MSNTDALVRAVVEKVEELKAAKSKIVDLEAEISDLRQEKAALEKDVAFYAGLSEERDSAYAQLVATQEELAATKREAWEKFEHREQIIKDLQSQIAKLKSDDNTTVIDKDQYQAIMKLLQ
jgi:predicted  nucleic acid-binding Zn-ribbon protein